MILGVDRMLLTMAMTLAMSGVATAQTTWERGTTLNVFGGAASATSELGPAGGFGMGWELTPRIAVEGSATWIGLTADTDAFAAAVRAKVNLATARPVVPFLAGGVGLYRASFHGIDAAGLPGFYRDRVGGESGGLGTSVSFTDPSLVAGGGVTIFLTRHLAIRPEVEAIVVMRDSRTHMAGVAGVHLAYHFEEHPITPSRRPSR